MDTAGWELSLFPVISGENQGKAISGNRLTATLLELQMAMERRLLYPLKPYPNADEVRHRLKLLPSVHYEVPSGSWQTKPLGKTLKTGGIETGHDLWIDLTALGVDAPKGDIPFLGCWFLRHHDRLPADGLPQGLHEVAMQEEAIASMLWCQYGNRDSPVILDAAYFNRGWTMVETAQIAEEGAVAYCSNNCVWPVLMF